MDNPINQIRKIWSQWFSHTCRLYDRDKRSRNHRKDFRR